MINMKRLSIRIFFGFVAILIAGFVWFGNRDRGTDVTSFTECVQSGYPVMESYPRRCTTYNGESFVEDIGNELEKTDVIRVSSPRPNEIVSSPFDILGEARGGWYFEGSFPVELYDDDGQLISQGLAQSLSEWTTIEFVPFEGRLVFAKPVTQTGILILKKDNPSGLPENDDQLIVPVRFAE